MILFLGLGLTSGYPSITEYPLTFSLMKLFHSRRHYLEWRQNFKTHWAVYRVIAVERAAAIASPKSKFRSILVRIGHTSDLTHVVERQQNSGIRFDKVVRFCRLSRTCWPKTRPRPPGFTDMATLNSNGWMVPRHRKTRIDFPPMGFHSGPPRLALKIFARSLGGSVRQRDESFGFAMLPEGDRCAIAKKLSKVWNI